jgi:hypothetical protein
MGVADPDAWHRLKPRCMPCHSRKTALQEGGFGHQPVLSSESTATPVGPPETPTDRQPGSSLGGPGGSAAPA